MQISEIKLIEPSQDQGFIKANEKIIEQIAVKTLIDIMNSNAPPDTKVNAVRTALAALGRDKPDVPAVQGGVTNVQINAAIGSHVADALKGLGEMVLLRTNAPQTNKGADDEHAIRSTSAEEF